MKRIFCNPSLFKKVFSIFVLGFLFIACPFILFAQDSTGTSAAASGLPASWIQYLTIGLAVYEFIVRIFPTVKDISIVGNVFKFLTFISDALNKKA